MGWWIVLCTEGEEGMNKNYYIEELTKRVESLEKRLEALERILIGDGK